MSDHDAAVTRSKIVDYLLKLAWKDLVREAQDSFTFPDRADLLLARVDRLIRIRDAERAARPQAWIAQRPPDGVRKPMRYEHERDFLVTVGWGPQMLRALGIVALLVVGVLVGHFAT